MNETIFQILLWALPILLTILGFIGSIAIKALMSLAQEFLDLRTAIRDKYI